METKTKATKQQEETASFMESIIHQGFREGMVMLTSDTTSPDPHQPAPDHKGAGN